MAKRKWSDTWKDNWKGHYQDKNDPYKSNVFCEDHKTKKDKAKENMIRNIKQNIKQKKDESVFMGHSTSQKRIQKDYELLERAEEEGNSVIIRSLIGKVVSVIIIVLIVWFILGRI